MNVTLLAHRGFGDQKPLVHLATVGWSYTPRSRRLIRATYDDRAMPAAEWVPRSGHEKMPRDVHLTVEKVNTGAYLVVHSATKHLGGHHDVLEGGPAVGCTCSRSCAAFAA